ncbi:hypothetical protein [Marinicella rhabdoformis]|uniref:hypothetical protein n=1 Tax=Marinicella rhabdoformis TaxID=2580566 RepID=UPI0012AEC258|nr:hypothetical protein [Marinicella rhabdoformis]
MIKGVTLTSDTSEHMNMETKGYWVSWRIAFMLVLKYGFKREGKVIGTGSPFESIYQDYIEGQCKIKAGFEGMLGYYWSAENDEADQFIKTFHQKHCQ